MLAISESNKKDVNDFKYFKDFKDLIDFKNNFSALPRLKRWFFPRSLGRALWGCDEHKPTADQAWRVLDAYLNKTSLSNRQKIPCIADFSQTKLFSAWSILLDEGLLTGLLGQDQFKAIVGHKHPRTIAAAFIEAEGAGLFKGDEARANLDVIAGHDKPMDVTEAFIKLRNVNLLVQANRDALVKHKDPRALALSLIVNKDLFVGIEGQANRDSIVRHKNPNTVAGALYSLKKADLLTSDNRESIAGHENPSAVVDILCLLQEVDLFTPVNRDTIAKHSNLNIVDGALRLLDQAGLLRGEQTSFDAILGEPNSLDLARVFIKLHDVGLLTSANRGIIARDSNRLDLARTILKLHDLGLLTPANQEIIAGHHSTPSIVAGALIVLHDANLLTPANQDSLARYENLNYLTSAFDELKVMSLLNQKNFDALVPYCDPSKLIKVLHMLDRVGIITGQEQAAFDAIITHSTILFEGPAGGVWDKIPLHLFTAAVFKEMIRIAEDYRDMPDVGHAAFRDYVNDTFGQSVAKAAGYDPRALFPAVSKVNKVISEPPSFIGMKQSGL